MGDASKEMDTKSPQVSFQSKELETLLDMIDQLRAQGISRFIDLPQMIVCGDQSSGKSSVLEAVSGVRFPTKDNLCTRFPTELILRRSPNVSTSISIVPDAGRSDAEKAQLQAFSAGSEALEDFGEIVEAAGKAMGLDKNSKVFSNDVLRVELTGPKLPHLTLVDLPGLFHAGNKNQSADDAEAVKALVTKYMQKSRSIILAVVSAKNDYANQIVTKYARDVDPSGDRTLGIITKPDTLHAGSESEKQFFELAENKDVVLRLGWHVLKNRDFDTKDSTAEERDQAEAAFFNKGIWTSLKPTQMGINTLKPRLSRVLKEQILSELPGLIADVEAGIADCESSLDRLGGPRATKSEQRRYLHSVSQNFGKLVDNALGGRYHDEFFRAGPPSESYEKRLRAVVYNTLDSFAKEMGKHGHQYEMIKEEDEDEDEDEDELENGSSAPLTVTREERLDHVAKLIRENRGLELPGFSKHETITMLFREQCDPWTGIVRKYAQRLFVQVRAALLHILDDTADQATRDGIVRFLINPALENLKKNLDEKVAQNLRQHVSSHPMTFNHYFTDNVQKLRSDHQVAYLKKNLCIFFGAANADDDIDKEFNLSDLARALAENIEQDSMEFTCSEALHFMEAYYKVALKFLIDDFSVHTIEQGLLTQLPGMFDPDKVLMLDDEAVQEIAGETEESQAERASSSTKLEALRKALDALHGLDRGRPKVNNK